MFLTKRGEEMKLRFMIENDLDKTDEEIKRLNLVITRAQSDLIQLERLRDKILSDRMKERFNLVSKKV